MRAALTVALLLLAVCLVGCHLIFPFHAEPVDAGPADPDMATPPDARFVDGGEPLDGGAQDGGTSSDATVDAHATDTLISDASGPDASGTPCPGGVKTLSTSASTKYHTFDIALDPTGTPHMFLIESTKVQYHQYNQGWVAQVLSLPAADRLAVAITSGSDIHLAFRDTAYQQKLRYTHKKPSAMSWDPVKNVSAKTSLGESLDISARGAVVYIAADHLVAKVSGQALVKVIWSGSSPSFTPIWYRSSAAPHYRFSRVAVGATAVATTAFNGTGLQVESTPLTGSTGGKKSGISGNSSPLPVAADATSGFWTVSAADVGKELSYGWWDGSSIGISNDTLKSSAVSNVVLDVAAGVAGEAYFVYRGSSGAATGLQLIKRSATGWGAATPVTSDVADDVRLAVSPALKQAWLVYRVGMTLKVTCQPLP